MTTFHHVLGNNLVSAVSFGGRRRRARRRPCDGRRTLAAVNRSLAAAIGHLRDDLAQLERLAGVAKKK